MKSLRVLIVEDNVINQKVATKMLERMHIASDIVENGAEAVTALKNFHYDLVLMDLQMPVMDGLEATRQIRAMEGTEKHTTIIALTANVMSGDREQCLEAGMDDYLSKPMKQEDLEQMINKWIEKTTTESAQIPKQHSPNAEEELIDPARIKEILDLGDEGLLKELLEIFLDDGKKALQEIESAIAANNNILLRESSHRLKGVSANLGMNSLATLSSSLEQFALSNNSESAKELLATLSEQFEKVKQHITLKYIK